jgi:hypothetical protein
MKLSSFGLVLPLFCSTAVFATSFTGAPSGPIFSNGCDVGVGASLIGSGLTGTTNGMTAGGTLLTATAGIDLGGTNACSMTLTSTRQMNDAAGAYNMSSQLTGNTLLGVDLTLLGGASISVATYLAGQPGTVATATYNFPLLSLLGAPVNVSSGLVPILTSGTDILTQVVTLSYSGSILPILAGVNASLLTSPQFISNIEAVDPGQVPETGTVLLVSIGMGLLSVSRYMKRKNA